MRVRKVDSDAIKLYESSKIQNDWNYTRSSVLGRS